MQLGADEGEGARDAVVAGLEAAPADALQEVAAAVVEWVGGRARGLLIL